MCGIAGIFDTKGVDRSSLTRLQSLLLHRGPDGSGEYISSNNQLGLVQTRLSIIDTSERASQPMGDESGRFQLIYNGEVYNHKEIRSELEKLGHSFRSDSDTEVILNSFIEWGVECFSRFEGMFALAIWDTDSGRLILARDPLGIKPIYYWEEGRFVFSSEIGSLSQVVGREVNNRSQDLYLGFGFVPGPRTILKGITLLEAGHYLVVNGNSVEKHRYFDLEDTFGASGELGREEAVEMFSVELERSVHKHLISDVPLGVFLSGGVDSSSIVSLASRAGQRIKTLSVVFPGMDEDESKYARLVSQRFDTEHTEIEVGEDELLDLLKDFILAMDQPTIDGFNTYIVSWAAKKAGLKVCLSGLGGDELFGGYSTFDKVKLLYRTRNIWRHLGPVFNKLGSKGERLSKMSESPSLENIYLGLRRLSLDGELSLEDTSSLGTLDERISFLELSLYMREQLLRDSDVFGMAHSIELRVPFVDRQLVRAAGQIPPQYRFENNPNKRFLIDAVGDLPRECYRRPKQGFVLPFERWMKGPLRDEIETTLRNSSLGQRLVQKELDGLYNGNSHWSRAWSFFVLTKKIL